MNKTRVISLGALAIVLSGLGIRHSFASDHADAPATKDDPSADIADVYAFMRPKGTAPDFQPSSHLVVAMTVHPAAPTDAEFEPLVDYTLSISGLDDPAAGILGTLDATVTCRFYPSEGTNDAGLPSQPFTCTGNGAFFTGTTNEVAGNPADRLRVFAGLRSDPAFGDVQRVVGTLRANQKLSADGGANDFAGNNVLAIVAEVDVARVLFPDASPSAVGVSAYTERL